MRQLAEAPGQVDIRARAHLFFWGLLALQFDAARGLPGESLPNDPYRNVFIARAADIRRK